MSLTAGYANSDSTMMDVTMSGVLYSGVVEQNPLWREVMAEVERTKSAATPLVIAPYVAPVIPLIDRAKAELNRTEHWGSRALEELQLTGALTVRGRANLEYRAALRDIVAGTRATWPEEPANV